MKFFNLTEKCMRFRYQSVFTSSLAIFSVTLTFAQGSQTLTREQAIEDFKWLRFALEYSHPRLYKYDDKKTVDVRFDSVQNLITDTISGADFLKLIGVSNAAVRCGHLYTIPQEKLAEEILAKKVLPFYIKIVSGKIYSLHDCSSAVIPSGSQILSINGNSYNKILNTILPGIAVDGYIKTRKYRLMERYFFDLFHGFDLYYYLHVDRSDSFKIEYIDYRSNKRKSKTLSGITSNERRKILLDRYNIDERHWFDTPSPKFELSEQDNYALLTISRSFYDKKIDPDFDSLLDSAFSAIRDKSISNLIIDLRNNEGGSEQQQATLMSYLYPQPFKLYQNIYVSRLDYSPLKSVLNLTEKDTATLVDKNEDEWMRKIKDDLWINNHEYYEGLQLQPSKKNVFSGSIYVLMNGVCFSSASALIANIKNTTKAIFIGEESGGTFEGPTGGQTVPIILPHSKIMVRISPNIHLGYKYQKHPIGRGVFPTHQIDYTVRDIVEGKDLELELAKTLIQTRK